MIKQEQKEQNLVECIRQLYYNSKFQDCIQLINDSSNKNLFDDYKIAQLYKSICYIEQGFYQQGFSCFDNLLDTITQNRTENKKIDHLEVIIRSFHQWQTYYYNQDSSVKINEQLKTILEDYKNQNENSSNYSIGAYQFGLGTYQMVVDSNYEDQRVGRNLIILAKSNLKEFEQDFIPLISWTYYLENKTLEALNCINELFTVNPKFPFIRNYIAIYQSKLQLYEEAEKNYLQLISEYPSNILLLANIALFQVQQNNFEKAREYIEKAYEIDPKNPFTCYVYANILEQSEEDELQRQILQKGIEDNPDYAQLYVLMYNLEYKYQNYDSYIQNLEKCVYINPNNCEYQIYWGLGHCYIGQYEKSNSILYQCLQLKSSIDNKKTIYYLISYNHKKLLQFQQSLSFILKCLDLNIPSSQQRKAIHLCRNLFRSKNLRQIEKIEQLDQCYTYFTQKIDSLLSENIPLEIKLTLFQKQKQFLQFMMILAYDKEVKPYLSYQKNYSHWDLLLD